MILCGLDAAWDDHSILTQNTIDVVLFLRAIIRNDRAIQPTTLELFRTRVVAITQYLRLPDPRDQSAQLRGLVEEIAAAVDVTVCGSEYPPLRPQVKNR